jgi:hypothetical protein
MSAIPKTPELQGGFAPLGPLPGFYPGPAGDLKRSPDPSPTHAPLTTNPGSAPDFGVCLIKMGVLKGKVNNIVSYAM